MLLLALVLRLAFLLLGGINAPLTGDEVQYQQLAVNVASGRGFVQDNNPFFPGQTLYAWQAPLYPLALAVLYLLFGPHVLVAKLFGLALGVGMVWLAYDLARRIFSDARAAWWAALFVAVYPGWLTTGHLLLSETLFAFLLLLSSDLVAATLTHLVAYRDSDSKGRAQLLGLAAAAGLAWGAASLTRGTALYFALPLALWLALMFWRDVRGPDGKGTARPAPVSVLAPAAVLLVAAAAVLAPWTARNYAVFGQFVLLETKGGVNFWLGNSPYTPDAFIRNVWKTGVRDPMLAALPQDELSRDRTAYALGLAYIQREPLTFIAHIPVKFADFWGFERNLVDVAESTRTGKSAGWSSPAKLSADVLSAAAYVLLVLLAIAGLLRAPDDRWKLLFGGLILYFVALHLVVFADGRFHLPLIPFLALYGGWAVAQRAGGWRADKARAAAWLGLAVVFVAIWANEVGAAISVLTSR